MIQGVTKKAQAVPAKRRSACDDAAFRAQLERIKRMTVEERILASLSLRRRFDWLPPKPHAR